MVQTDIIVSRDGGIQTITINRPDVLNAAREETFHELEEALTEIAKDDGVRVVIVTGAGDRAFCAGGDVRALAKMSSADAESFARLAHRVLDRMEDLPKPIIAAVNGFALGAGCDLVTACDLVIASDRAVFGQPPAGLGLTTPFGGTQRLPRIIGHKRAKHLFFTCDTIDAETALRLGLVNKVVRHEELLKEAKAVAEKIISRAPIAVGFSKELVNMSMKTSLRDGDEREIELYARCFDTEDKMEGVSAFLEKRKPNFRGR